ncbi:hypothetical protein LSTR_LSTR006326 [Laodelphax striatellus]|uniref:Regulatory protein zeste n=1 Tax=Laodelphax striatellus TaxID=195883 RepID=A0A482XCT3_LAOST|nr:hypothetical protein LSTR_LSTR006326 [Laodelphax striatellus]
MEEKKRSKNFSNEIQLLLKLVRQKKFLECKKNDVVLQKDKLLVWKKLENDLNNLSGEVFCYMKILKGKYENIKKNSKKRSSEEKTYARDTGGGPSKPSTITSTDLQIKNILGENQIEGLQSEFDSDFTEMDSSNIINNIEEATNNGVQFMYLPIITKHESEEHLDSDFQENLKSDNKTVDWGDIKNLKKQVSTPLRMRRSSRKKSQFNRTVL